MSRPTSPRTKSSPKFVILSGVIVVASAAALAALWPTAHAFATWKSQDLVNQGRSSRTAEEGAANFQLATWLNPANQTAQFNLGQARLDLGQPNAALTALNQAGQGSDTLRLKLRVYLEQGRHTDAVQTAQELLSAATVTDTDRILACHSYALVGRAAQCQALRALVTSPQALQALSRAEAGKIPAANELYVLGLPNSSERILLKLPASYERNYILGRINYDRHTESTLQQAADYLTSAIQANPATIEARQILAAVYRAQDKPDAASAQDTMATKLRAGRP
jgi:thioredoxin-like negative regulator of GroEL